MSVRIELDKHGSVFTCLDYVTGKVVLNLANEETIAAITVKMEGVSRTRIEPPRPAEPQQQRRNERRNERAEVEIHRLLYVVHTVFPSKKIEQATSTTGFTLKAGQYEYPFSIRIPINNSCTEGAKSGVSLLNKLSFEHGKVDFARDAQRHMRGTLPPSLSRVDGEEAEAWIRYFLKVTVNRPKLLKTNMRTHDPFVFLPIEPPRPPPSTSETFARRRHEFVQANQASKKKGLFGSLRQQPPPLVTDMANVRFSVDVRLPSPAIVVPTEPLPLRILIVKQEEFNSVVTIRSLQVTLVSKTHITAHDLSKDCYEVVSLLSMADINIPFGTPGAPVGTEIEADRRLWGRISLPDTIPPSFTTCNIVRSYHMEIAVGLSCDTGGHVDVLPFSLPVDVFSGIKPPQKLLDASRYTPTPKLPPRKPISSLQVPASAGPWPNEKQGVYKGTHSAVTSPENDPFSPPLPPRPSSSHQVPSYTRPNDGTADEMPPPTYEDAIAEDIGPVDGPRPQFQQDRGYYQALPDDVAHGHR